MIQELAPFPCCLLRKVRLGCNEGWRKGCANYFLLFGADYPIHQGAVGSEDRAAPNPSSSPLSGSLPPHPSPPVGLLPDGDVGDMDFASPRWVLRPQMVAGGKGSLAQAVRALVDERRKSRAMARSQLLPGAWFPEADEFMVHQRVKARGAAGFPYIPRGA